MRLVDSSAWIEWLIGSRTGRALGSALPGREDTLVPTIVQHELAKWLNRVRGEDEADRFVAFTLTCVVAPLDTKIALAAADICRTYRLATADAIVYATAIENDADLLTCDAHFRGLPGVVLVARSAT